MIADEKDFFRQATLRICSNLDNQVAMKQCLEYLAEVMPADWLILNVYSQGLGAVQTLAIASTSDDLKIGTMTPLPTEVREFLADSGQKTRIRRV